MLEPWLQELLNREDVGRLATSSSGQPHIVPVVFVGCDDRIFIPIDGKPKSGRKLKRVANIESNPHVSLLLDCYDSDWAKLWWVRIDGHARVEASPSQVLEMLNSKYEQYKSTSVGSQCISIEPLKTSRWAASPTWL